MADITITTPRTVLRPWKWSDLSDFADMHADEEVMSFVGGPVSIATCTDLIDWYRCAYEEHGFCRWAVQNWDRAFLGCTGVMPMQADLPIAPGFEIGWRFIRSAWGQGLATEAAQAALCDAFDRVGLPEVVAYCAPDNCRSQAVARRFQMRRDARAILIWQKPNGPAKFGSPPANPKSLCSKNVIRSTKALSFRQFALKTLLFFGLVLTWIASASIVI